MDINKLTDLAQAWSDLGWAVREQAVDILENGTSADVNSNAARMVAEWAAMANSAGVEGADLLMDDAMELAGM